MITIVGAGRVGQALEAASRAKGIDVRLLDRSWGSASLSGPQGDPIVLAVRNDDLVQIVGEVPAHRRADLVFVQNGALRELLRACALSQNTRGLLYFAVARRGDPISPGHTSWFCGEHGLQLARWLGHLGLTAESVDWARFSAYELEKLLWLAVHGPLCEAHGATVGEVATTHRDELAALVDELRRLGRAAMGVDVPQDWLLPRLVDYSTSIGDYRASVKEWPWRNGWLVDQSRRLGIDTPCHDAALRAAGQGARLDG